MSKSFVYDIPSDIDISDPSDPFGNNGMNDGTYIAFFRPLSTWLGVGFGFDFVPDTFFLYEKMYDMGKQYKKGSKSDLVTDPNQYNGDFRDANNEMLSSLLKNEYKSYKIHDTKYFSNNGYVNYSPWLSLYPKKGTRKIKKYREVSAPTDDGIGHQIILEPYYQEEDVQYTENTKAEINVTIFGSGTPDYFAFEPNEHFKITPEKLLEIKDKKTLQNELDTRANQSQVDKRFMRWDNLKVTIECLTEFAKDQELILYAYTQENGTLAKKKAGSIWVWGNMRCKTSEVVFIEVTTPPMSYKDPIEGVAPANVNGINKYLRQALVQIELLPVLELDVSEDPNFGINGIYRSSDKINDAPSDADPLHVYLNSKIDAKYRDYYKVYFINESLINPSTRGYNNFSTKTTVMYYADGNILDNIIAHELFHGLNLQHVFTNYDEQRKPTAKYTYQSYSTNNIMDYTYKGKESVLHAMWYWQWKMANENAK